MDASCKIQGSIHVFRLVNNMCPGKWVHIILSWCLLAFVYAIVVFIKFVPNLSIFVPLFYNNRKEVNYEEKGCY